MSGLRIMLQESAQRRRGELPSRKTSCSETRNDATIGQEMFSSDKYSGLDQNITRRDFLNATLLASGGVCC